MKEKDDIEELERIIRKHQYLYYNNEPEISDEEFDVLWDRLKILKPDSDLFNTVGRDVNDGFKKAKHIIPMGSQDKASNSEEFLRWASKQSSSKFLVQYKLDGASIELQYANGEFKRAVTRGDGTVGDDITDNVLKMQGVVKSIKNEISNRNNVQFSGAVRGEILMSHAVHRSIYSDKANCRNAANGIMKRKDGKGSEYLEIVCYDVGCLENVNNKLTVNSAPYSDELEKIQWLNKSGFKTVETKLCSGVDEVVEYRKKIAEKRALLPFDIDGLVVKSLEIDLEDWKKVRPEKQIAFKFETEKAVSIVKDVEWSESGATYTPVAIIDEVQLAGTTVRRASLANTNVISNLGIMIGSKVLVAKRGEIIPKIEEVLENPQGSIPINIPSICTSCGTSLTCDGGRLYCPNKNCKKLSFHRIKKWIDVLEIREVGPTLLDHLFTSGHVSKIQDLYLLSVETLSSVERMGSLSSRKVYDSIHSRNMVTLSQFVAGFDLENIGLTMADKIVFAGFNTIEKLFSITEENLESIEGFAQKMAHSFVTQLNDCKTEMQELLASGYISIENTMANHGKLVGISFCFTGELKKMKRKEAGQLVINAGGTVKASVTTGLTYLVTNDANSTSTKTKRAKELNIKIIDEDEFFAML